MKTIVFFLHVCMYVCARVCMYMYVYVYICAACTRSGVGTCLPASILYSPGWPKEQGVLNRTASSLLGRSKGFFCKKHRRKEVPNVP